MHPPRLLVATALAAAGGLVTNLAFPHHSWWFLAFAGVALLQVALRGARQRRGFLLGLVWGLTFFLPLLSWSIVSVGGMWIPWLALSVYQSLYIALYGLLHALVMSREVSRGRGVLVVPFLWVAVEQFRMLFPFGGFPWGALAFSQVEGPLLPLASWGGTPLTSLVVVGVGAVLAGLVMWPGLRSLVAAGAAVVVVAASAAIPLDAGAESGEIAVAAIQGNVPVRGGEALGQARQITANYRAITERLADGGELFDVVLWPESAADVDPRSHDDVAADVTAAQDAAGVALLFGTQRYTEEYRYNEYVAWLDGEAIGAYTKQHPVPFGEYIPFRDFFRTLSSAVDLVTVDMAQGQDPGVLEIPVERLDRTVTFGVGICFEVAYHELLRESVAHGAELLVIPTNNASFGFTQEATQQLGMSRFRAVEHGRSTVQVSTVGVSAFFLPDGSTLARSSDELYTEWVGLETLPLRTSTTVSDKLGELPRTLVWIVALVWIVTALVSSRRRT